METYVLVMKTNFNTWFKMNKDRKVIEEMLETQKDCCLARWTYKRYDTGDELIKQETFFEDRTVINLVNRDLLPNLASSFDIDKAMQRLVDWSKSDYNLVKILNDGKDNMIAYYLNTKNGAKFEMGAVWRKETNKFTFHS